MRVASLESTAFANLSASAPIAKFITVVRDFVVCANTYESAAQQQYRVRWSAINDETDWVENVNTQSDYQDIPDGGQIVGIRGGEKGFVDAALTLQVMSPLAHGKITAVT